MLPKILCINYLVVVKMIPVKQTTQPPPVPNVPQLQLLVTLNELILESKKRLQRIGPILTANCTDSTKKD